MKIKIFAHSDLEELEREINTWLRENRTVQLWRIKQSESDGEEGWGVTISILYRESQSDWPTTF